MRILSLICMLVVMALNCVPCADVHNDEVAQTSVSSDEGGHHDFPVEDNCTPFCQCGCCGSHVITVIPHYAAEALVIIGKGSLFYTSKHFPNVGQSIWQPPRIRV